MTSFTSKGRIPYVFGSENYRDNIWNEITNETTQIQNTAADIANEQKLWRILGGPEAEILGALAGGLWEARHNAQFRKARQMSLKALEDAYDDLARTAPGSFLPDNVKESARKLNMAVDEVAIDKARTAFKKTIEKDAPHILAPSQDVRKAALLALRNPSKTDVALVAIRASEFAPGKSALEAIEADSSLNSAAKQRKYKELFQQIDEHAKTSSLYFKTTAFERSFSEQGYIRTVHNVEKIMGGADWKVRIQDVDPEDLRRRMKGLDFDGPKAGWFKNGLRHAGRVVGHSGALGVGTFTFFTWCLCNGERLYTKEADALEKLAKEMKQKGKEEGITFQELDDTRFNDEKKKEYVNTMLRKLNNNELAMCEKERMADIKFFKMLRDEYDCDFGKFVLEKIKEKNPVWQQSEWMIGNYARKQIVEIWVDTQNDIVAGNANARFFEKLDKILYPENFVDLQKKAEEAKEEAQKAEEKARSLEEKAKTDSSCEEEAREASAEAKICREIADDYDGTLRERAAKEERKEKQKEAEQNLNEAAAGDSSVPYDYDADDLAVGATGFRSSLRQNLATNCSPEQKETGKSALQSSSQKYTEQAEQLPTGGKSMA